MTAPYIESFYEQFMGRPVYVLYKSPAAVVLSSGEATLEGGRTCGIPELASRQMGNGQNMPVPVLGVTCEIVHWDEKKLVLKALCADERTPQVVMVDRDNVHSITMIPEHVPAEQPKPKVIL